MFKIPDYVEEIIDRLELEGYKAYLVGGAVRDLYMGGEVKDYDLTTDCRPEIIEEIFKDKEKQLIGKAFGTVNIVNRGHNIEVTTFRSESSYRDGRRPEEISFSNSLAEDLKRRDFTINAMAYNKREGLIDLFSSREDIEAGIIRAVGNPEERFKEDYLRILRAVRFSGRLGFKIDEESLAAMKENVGGLRLISCERIRDEFFKMLVTDRPSSSIRLLDEIGALEIILPELSRLKGFDQKNPNHSMDVYDHTLCVLDRTGPRLSLRLGALFHDIGKYDCFSLDDEGVGHFYGHNTRGGELSNEILNRFNSPNSLKRDVKNLVHYHMNAHDRIKKPGLKRLIRRFGEDKVFDLIELQLADLECSSNRREDREALEKRSLELKEIIRSEEAYEKKDLAISGRELLELGYKEGRLIGEILDYLMEEVLEDNEKNKRDILIKISLEKFPLKD